MIQATQTKDTCQGDTVSFSGTCSEDMTGWTVVAVVYDASGNVLTAAVPVFTISDGPNGTGTVGTITFASGFTEGLSGGPPPVPRSLVITKTDPGAVAELAALKWVVVNRKQPWLTG